MAVMGQSAEFGQFLRVMRARMRPEAAGLPTTSTARRVPGLRREEIAQLAGVSTDYYTRLEQGRQIRPSQAVIDAVARVAAGPARRDRTHHRPPNPGTARRRTTRPGRWPGRGDTDPAERDLPRAPDRPRGLRVVTPVDPAATMSSNASPRRAVTRPHMGPACRTPPICAAPPGGRNEPMSTGGTPNPVTYQPNAKYVLLLGLMCALPAVTSDIYLPSLPDVARDLDTTTTGVQLTMTGVLVGAALGQLVIGPLSDRLGRRRPVLVGIALHIVVSLLCAIAPGIGTLIALRVVQGFFNSAATVVAIAVIQDRFVGSDASRLLSRLMLVIGVAPLFAPSVGGLARGVRRAGGVRRRAVGRRVAPVARDPPARATSRGGPAPGAAGVCDVAARPPVRGRRGASRAGNGGADQLRRRFAFRAAGGVRIVGEPLRPPVRRERRRTRGWCAGERFAGAPGRADPNPAGRRAADARGGHHVARHRRDRGGRPVRAARRAMGAAGSLPVHPAQRLRHRTGSTRGDGGHRGGFHRRAAVGRRGCGQPACWRARW